MFETNRDAVSWYFERKNCHFFFLNGERRRACKFYSHRKVNRTAWMRRRIFKDWPADGLGNLVERNLLIESRIPINSFSKKIETKIDILGARYFESKMIDDSCWKAISSFYSMSEQGWIDFEWNRICHQDFEGTNEEERKAPVCSFIRQDCLDSERFRYRIQGAGWRLRLC